MNVKGLLTNVSAEAALGLGIGFEIVGLVAAGEARLRADDILAEMERERYDNGIDEPMTTIEKTKATWTCYILPVVCGAASIGFLVWSHKIQGDKLVALATAYTITKQNFADYKAKAKEVLSQKKFDEIQHEIDQDKVSNMTMLDRDILSANNGDVLCVDAWSGMKFFSNAEAIRQAVARSNQRMIGDISISLNELYDEIGNLGMTKSGDVLGWNALHDDPIEVSFSSVLDKENIPTLVMHLEPDPRPMFQDC